MAATTTTIISIAMAYLLLDVAADATAAEAAAAAAAAVAATAAAAQPPQLGCFSYLSNAGACLSFITNGSELRYPARGCCPELANLTGTHPVCLCQLLSNSSQFGFSIDANNAFKLPSLCNLSISSPFALCTGAPLPKPSPSPAAKAPGNKVNASPTIGVVLLLILYMSII